MTSTSDVFVRQVSSRDSAGLAVLRRAKSEELVGAALDDDGFEERSVPFYQRAGFGPATMLMAKNFE